MSDPRLPSEMLDHIVDYLHDTEDALKNCCLVPNSGSRAPESTFLSISRSLVQMAYNHGRTCFQILQPLLRVTSSLFVGCSEVVMGADAASGWIGGFSCVVRLILGNQETVRRRVLSRTTSRIFTHHYIPLRGLRPLSVPTDLQPHSFIPTSRGSGCGRFLRCVD
jgi:hypothetical protein